MMWARLASENPATRDYIRTEPKHQPPRQDVPKGEMHHFLNEKPAADDDVMTRRFVLCQQLSQITFSMTTVPNIRLFYF